MDKNDARRYELSSSTDNEIILRRKDKIDPKEYILLFFFTLLLICLICFVITERKNFFHDDAKVYLSMAITPFENLGDSPLSFRFLPPLIVHYLPFDLITNFYLLTISSLMATCFFFFLYLRILGFKPLISLIGVKMFIFSSGVIYNLSNPIYIDSIGYLFIIIAFYLIETKRGLFLSFVGTMGVLVRENVLFVLPLYYYTSKKLAKTIWVISPCIILFISMRLIFDGNFFHYYFSIENLTQVWEHHFSKGGCFSIYSSFGIAWILTFVNISKVKNFLKINILYVFFVLLSFIVASDEIRMLSYLFPIILPIALLEFEKIQKCRYKFKKNILISLLLFGYILSVIQHKWTIFGRDTRYILVLLGSFIGLTILYRSRKRGSVRQMGKNF